MSEEKSNKVLYITPKKETIAASRELVSKLAPLSGSEAINMVLELLSIPFSKIQKGAHPKMAIEPANKAGYRLSTR